MKYLSESRFGMVQSPLSLVNSCLFQRSKVRAEAQTAVEETGAEWKMNGMLGYVG